MANYSETRLRAYDLLNRKGSALTLYRLAKPAYNPLATDEEPAEVALTSPAVGVVLPSVVKALREFDDFLRQNPRYVESFRAIYVSGQSLTFEPTVDDILQTPEGFFRIVGRVTLDPGGDGPILYTLGVVSDLPYCELVILVPDTAIFLDGYTDDYLIDESDNEPLLYD